MSLLKEERIVRLEICTLSGNRLYVFSKNQYSFPKTADNRNGEKLIIFKGKNLPVFPKGSKISLIFFMMSGDRISYNSYIGVSTDNQLNLYMLEDTETLLEERRRFFKIESDEKCKIVMVNRGDDLLELDPPIEGIIGNINLGGIFLKINSNVEFKVDDVITILLPNLMGSRVELLVKILRAQITPNGEKLGYGCCFMMMSPRQEEIIAKYINHLQLVRRKVERESELLQQERLRQ